MFAMSISVYVVCVNIHFYSQLVLLYVSREKKKETSNSKSRMIVHIVQRGGERSLPNAKDQTRSIKEIKPR